MNKNEPTDFPATSTKSFEDDRLGRFRRGDTVYFRTKQQRDDFVRLGLVQAEGAAPLGGKAHQAPKNKAAPPVGNKDAAGAALDTPPGPRAAWSPPVSPSRVKPVKASRAGGVKKPAKKRGG